MIRSKPKQYTVTLILDIEEDADFFEADNGHNLDVIEQVFEEMVYDQSDMKLKLIEVEFTG